MLLLCRYLAMNLSIQKQLNGQVDDVELRRHLLTFPIDRVSAFDCEYIFQSNRFKSWLNAETIVWFSIKFYFLNVSFGMLQN